MSSNRYLSNKKSIESTDILLASYPRSGNTWMRLLLSDALLQLHGIHTNTGGNIIPDIYKVNIDEWNKYFDRRLSFRIAKTHEPLLIEKNFFDLQNRIIYLFRNPADCLCSHYHYWLRYPKNQKKDKGIDNFCLKSLEQWCQHVETYIKIKEKNPKNVIFLSYEALHYNPVQVLLQVLILLGWNNCQVISQRAVEHQEFQKVQSLATQEQPEKMGFWEDYGFHNFFRKGKINSFKEELSVETINIIENKAKPVYNRAKIYEPVFDFEFSGQLFEKRLIQIQKTQDRCKKSSDYFVRAKKLHRLGKLEEAIANYRQAIKLNPNLAWYYYNLGEALGETNAWEEAIANYHQAIAFKPDSGWLHYSLAKALIKQNQINEAVTYYQKAIQLQPNQNFIRDKLEKIFT